KGVIKTVGLSFGLNMSYLCFFIVGLSVIINRYFAMLLIYVWFPFSFLLVSVTAYVYKKSGSIIPGAIINSLYCAGLAIALSPYGGITNLFSSILG
ncbi:MAG: hypothetical protein GY870_09585, partial [archaeon]|nr:hypothetical protein [archaeon]